MNLDEKSENPVFTDSYAEELYLDGVLPRVEADVLDAVLTGESQSGTLGGSEAGNAQ